MLNESAITIDKIKFSALVGRRPNLLNLIYSQYLFTIELPLRDGMKIWQMVIYKSYRISLKI